MIRASLILTSVFAFALPAFASNIVGDKVVVRALDKVTATTKDFTVNVGESLDYGSLRVEIKHCEKKPPEEIPATWAFLQIFDKRTDGEGSEREGEKVFSGWMLAEKPAISALEHPVYDVWVIDCKGGSQVFEPELR